jgi:hypothetical protein
MMRADATGFVHGLKSQCEWLDTGRSARCSLDTALSTAIMRRIRLERLWLPGRRTVFQTNRHDTQDPNGIDRRFPGLRHAEATNILGQDEATEAFISHAA